MGLGKRKPLAASDATRIFADVRAGLIAVRADLNPDSQPRAQRPALLTPPPVVQRGARGLFRC